MMSQQMQPLIVTARLMAGVVTDGDLPLDGILAAQWMRQNHPDLYYTDTMAVKDTDLLIDAPLPLERRGNGDKWYWSASFAAWPEHAKSGKDFWNKRFDVKEADRIDFEGKRGKVIIEQSRYKAYHMPIYYIASATVSWFVFGDGQAIDYLLLKVNSIGKKRSQGWGQVLDWRIEPAQEDYSEYRDGNGNGNGNGDKNKNKPSRTIPIDEENIPGEGNFGYRGYRPPYWHPARQSLVLLPDKDALCWQ